jgi:DNA-binding MarR family transcriptional regulator
MGQPNTKPDVSVPTPSLGVKEPADFLMDSTVTLLRALDGSRQRAAVGLGVNVTELRVLSRLAEAGHVTPSQLADGMAMTSGAITAISDSLVKAGLIERNAHPTDRRRNLLSLTTEGNAKMDGLYQGFTETLRRSVANYSVEQQSVAATMLLTIASSLSALPAPDETEADSSR